MKLKVKQIGSGVVGDPFRVPLPTYDMVSNDKATMTAVITAHLPDVICNSQDDEHAICSGLDVSKIGPGDLADLTRWYAHLDERYKEHAGAFRPELV